MSERRLTIAVKADTREGEKLKKFFSDLSMEGNKAAKAFSGISLSVLGKDGQKGAVAKTILESKNLLKDLGEHGKKLGSIFERDVAKGAQAMGDKLKDVNTRIKTLTDSYEKLNRLQKEAVAAGKGGEVYDRAIENVRRELGMAFGDKEDALKGLRGFGGGGGGFGNRLMGGAMEALAPFFPFIGGMGIGAAAYGMYRFGSQYVDSKMSGRISQAMYPYQTSAAVGSTTGQMNVAGAWGDFGQRFWDTQIGRNADGTIDPNSDYSKMLDAQLGAQQKAVFNNSRTGMFKNLEWFKWIRSFMDGTQESEDVKNRFDIGSAAFAQQGQEFFQNFVAGRPELTKQAGFFGGDYRDWLRRRRRWGMGYEGRSLTTGLAASAGIEEGDLIGGIGGAVNIAGSSGVRMAGSIAAAIASGMDGGAAGSIAGAGAAAGNTLSATAGRGLGPVVREMLGSAINQYLSSASILSGTGFDAGALGDVLSSGVTGSGAEAMRRLQQNVSGMGRLDSLTAGPGDAWQKSVNLASAIKNYGSGGSIYGANYLANMSFSDMAKFKGLRDDQLPPELRAFGINAGHINKQYSAFTNTIFSRFANNANDNTEGANLLRQVQAMGGDFKAWGKNASDDQKRMLGAYVSQIGGGLFGDVTDSEGIIRLLTGDAPARGGGAGGKRGPAGGEAPDVAETRRSFQLLKEEIDKTTSATGEFRKELEATHKRDDLSIPPWARPTTTP